MPRRKKTRRKWWQIDGLTMAVCILAVASGYFHELGKDAWHASKGGFTALVQLIQPIDRPLLDRNDTYELFSYADTPDYIPDAPTPPNKRGVSKGSYDDTWTNSSIGRLTSIDDGGGGYDFGGAGSSFDYGGGSTQFDPAGSTHFNPAGSTYFDPTGSPKSKA